jgi:periplasmic protein TonB
MWLRVGCLCFLIAVAMPGYAQTDVVAEWKKQLSIRLNGSKKFPPEAIGKSGTAKVGFVVDRSGKLISSWLMESTGLPVLDAEALAMVDRAQPFPAPPPEADDDRLNLAFQAIFVEGPPQTSTLEKENAVINAKMRGICRGC